MSDDPVEWGCAECNEPISISGAVREQARQGMTAPTCDDCDHVCTRPEADHLIRLMDDPALPDYIDVYRCSACGRIWHLDTETGTFERDVQEDADDD